MDRDRTKQLTEHAKEVNRKKQELNLTKNLRKEVEVGANGTQKYVIKGGGGALLRENILFSLATKNTCILIVFLS